MPAPTLPSDPEQLDPDGDPGEGGGRRRVGSIAAAVVLLGILGMWGFILVYHLSGQWRDETPGRLESPAYGEQAELVCSATLAQIDQLPPAFEASDAAERADVVDRSDAELTAMVDELTALAPLAGDEQPVVDEWLADWRTYIADRADYADRLRDDPDARFYVTQSDRDNRQITQAIDRFANVNGMPSCLALNDLG